MSVQSIITILEKLEKMHNSLLEHAYKKTELLINNDMAELDEMLKLEQSHVAAIEMLEQQRQTKVIEYFRTRGLEVPESPTVAELINVMEQAEERKQLEDVRNRLMNVIEKLKKQNDLNQQMIFNSLQFVNMSLNLLRPQPEQFNYTGKQALGGNEAPKKSFFDSQA